MPDTQYRIILCNCEKTMDVDSPAIGKALGRDIAKCATNLCRSGLSGFEDAIAGDRPVLVACTQEAALFSEIAEEAGAAYPTFFNLRELAGWTRDKRSPAPKMAALAAAAMVRSKPPRLRTIESDGLCLVVGSGQEALDAAILLNRSLSVTLLLNDASGIVLPPSLEFPVFSGRLALASGSLGHFEVEVNGYAAMLPSSRSEPQFTMARDGAKSQCSVIFDMSGGPAIFSRPEGRDGYFYVDPGNRAAVVEAVMKTGEMSGSFEKPIYVEYDAGICAHSRSKKQGCNKCIDNCPAGAISSAGDHVEIDAAICGGCGNCAAHCPSGAVSYHYPDRIDSISVLQVMARTYLAAGGKEPVLLLHDGDHGLDMINVMARLGGGLPANVIPFEMHSVSGIGHDFMAAAFASGFCGLVIVTDPRKASEYDALAQEIALIEAVLSGFQQILGRIAVFDGRDPEALETLLYGLKPGREVARQDFVPIGNKREVARTALSILAGKHIDKVIPLPETAPYGAVAVDGARCTLCFACVSACPADALSDNLERYELRFSQSACVQCGICKATCPENAITLLPQLDLTATAMRPHSLHEEEPAHCVSCGKAYAPASTIERMAERLSGKHSMFMDESRARLLKMCDTCRLEELAAGGGDPFAIAGRPRVRTTDDYIEAEKSGLSIDDFLIDDDDA